MISYCVDFNGNRLATNSLRNATKSSRWLDQEIEEEANESQPKIKKSEIKNRNYKKKENKNRRKET